MKLDEKTSNGMVYLWALIDGRPRCVADPINPKDALALQARETTIAIQAMVSDVETFEAAQAVVARGEPDNGAPKMISDPDAIRPEEAGDDWSPPLIVNPDWALAPRTVETVDDEGNPLSVPNPRWLAYDDAVAEIATATETTTRLAAWRAGPATEEDRPAWEAARDAVLAALESDVAARCLAALPEAKAARKAALAERRWQAETGGTIVGGLSIPTDAPSQAKFTSAALAAVIDPAYSVSWKLATGEFVALGRNEIIGLAQGARAHVQACFDREATLAAAIDAAATPAELAAINIADNWPT